MILDYITFLIKENKIDNELIYSERFKRVLDNIDSDISNSLKELLGKDNLISYVDITDKKDTVSFLQSKVLPKIEKNNDNPWEVSARQELKIGRFVKKLLGDLKLKDVEDFVNEYKSEIEYNSYRDRFDIVKGEDITKYYYIENQIPGGQLEKSCMGGYGQNKYIKSFFEPNPEKLNMLILRDKNNPDKIVGRANLWLLDKPINKIFMDRIYTNNDYLINIFIKFAKENNYIYKSRQIYGGHVVPVVDNGVMKNIKMSVNLNPLEYRYYPYVDTLQFYNKETGEITNDTDKWNETGDGKWIGLIHAGGYYLTKDNDDGFKMDYMGRLIHPYFVVKSKIDNCYIHQNDAIRLNYKNDYCRPDRDVVNIDGEFYLKEDTIYDEKTKEYKKK